MSLFEVIIILLVIVWLGGFSLKIGGRLIHVLLIIIVVILAIRLLGIIV